MQVDPQACPHAWEFRASLFMPERGRRLSKRDALFVFVCMHCTTVRVGERALPRRPRPLRAKAAEMDDFVVRLHDRLMDRGRS